MTFESKVKVKFILKSDCLALNASPFNYLVEYIHVNTMLA